VLHKLPDHGFLRWIVSTALDLVPPLRGNQAGSTVSRSCDRLQFLTLPHLALALLQGPYLLFKVTRLGFEPRPSGYIPGVLPTELPDHELLSSIVLQVLVPPLKLLYELEQICPGHDRL
jgi:hypothetical protein